MTSTQAIDYGPLAALTGTWRGDKGVDVAPEPTLVLTGTWTHGSKRALRSIVRNGIAADLVSCGNRDVRVRELRVRQRLARDAQSLTGAFTATVRYRFAGLEGTEEASVRIHGAYAGTRTAE